MYAVIVFALVWSTVTTNAQDHDVRLSNVGGSQGRVEVLNNGQWGSVCKDGWDFFDAFVVCKQLGFRWLAMFGWEQFAYKGTGPVWLSNVRCKGSETRLDECAHDGWMEHQCTDTRRAAAVKCVDEDGFIAGFFDLVDGYSSGFLTEGRVVLNLFTGDTQRFLICDQGWDLADANVLCRMTNQPSALRATTGFYFGRHDPNQFKYSDFTPKMSYLATDFACNGSEREIFECPVKAWFQEDCPTGGTAGVICNLIEDSEEFPVRLVGGSTPNEGRVEVFLNGTWGSICLREIHIMSLGYLGSNVICRQLGLGYGLETPEDEPFGRSDGPVAITGHISCNGNEPSFAHCYFSPLDKSPDQECFSKEDSYQFSVICSGPISESRSPVRLTGKGSGNVLIRHDGRWGSICRTGWTLANSDVACRELGFRAAVQTLYSSGFRERGPIFLSDVSCRGDEETLDQCDRGEWYQHNCTHSMDVYIVCIADYEEFPVRLVGGSTPNEGRVEVFRNGTWGSICFEDNIINLDYLDSSVICRQLGLGYGLETPEDEAFGRSDGPVAISDHFSCSGNEPSLGYCYFSPLAKLPDQECFSKEDSYQASVICSGPVPESRSPIRLTGKGYGHVLIYNDGRIGSICNTGWTLANSQVVCRELGFRDPKQALYDEVWRGRRAPMLLSGVSCRGDEETLDQCDRGEWYQHGCNHSATDVYIVCAAGCHLASLITLITSLVTALCVL